MKTKVWSGSTTNYDLDVYSSGGITHTGVITAMSGRRETRKFRSKYVSNCNAAIRWCQETAARYEEMGSTAGPKDVRK